MRAVIAAVWLLSSVTAGAELFEVKTESGTRKTSTGDTVTYTLYIPVAIPELPAPPWPAVVLNHGFFRTKETQANSALSLARRGIIVLTPDQVGLGGIVSRQTNVAVTLDHLDWLRTRGLTPGDPLDGRVDPHRFGLAGHSAGGAMSFEAAFASQSSDLPVAALFLLDAVPWSSTLETASKLSPIALGSLRSEPSPCNAKGLVRQLLGQVVFAVDDVLVVGATHCDGENPTDALCRLACGGSSLLRRYLYLRLMTLFFVETLNAPPVEAGSVGYGRTISWLEHQGLVVRETSGQAPQVE
jgi:pimeloyl-ACP methyl ester carboxylesterase